jgi:AraC-like DNA-binding protein
MSIESQADLDGLRRARTSSGRSVNKLWRVPDLNNLELSHASYGRWSFPRHSHPEYIIGVMVDGAEQIDYRGSTYFAPKGTVLLLNAGEPHANYSVDENGFSYRTLYPSLELLMQAVCDTANHNSGSPWFSEPVVQNGELANLLLRLHWTLEDSTSALEHECLFLSVVATLLRRHARLCPPDIRTHRGSRHVARAREYIDAHFRRNVSLAELSTLTGISPFHLQRLFVNTIGLSPFEYQMHLRITAAKNMLRRGLQIANVALEAGFVDQSHFSKHFKRVVGLTPGQFVERRKIIQDPFTEPEPTSWPYAGRR